MLLYTTKSSKAAKTSPQWSEETKTLCHDNLVGRICRWSGRKTIGSD